MASSSKITETMQTPLGEGRIDEENVYSQDQREMLCEYGLDWYADNPCVSAEELEKWIELDYTEKQFKISLKKRKLEIEEHLKDYTLDGNLQELRNDPKYPELRFLILGKVGQGKSSLGNLLTGGDGFEVFNTAKTGTRGSHYAASKKYNIRVMDTQGFADAGGGAVDLEMAKIFTNFKAGIHAFIFVLELSNPRLTEEDVNIFKNLEKTFGREILNYVFIVFTKAGALLGKQKKSQPEKTLKDYINELKQTPLAKALKVIGSNVIAVENKCVKYQEDLTRQAVLDLISESVSRSRHGCYTHEVLKEAEASMKREQGRRSTRRKDQKKNIEEKLIKVVKQDLSTLQSPNDVIQKADEGRTIAERFLKKNDAICIEGMPSIKDFVTETADRVLKELVHEDLKNKLAKHVKAKVTDPDKEVDVFIQALKEAFPRPFAEIGEPYIKLQFRDRISELLIEEAKKAAKEKRLMEEICVFISENISLFDNPKEMQRMLAERGEEFSGENMQQVIEDCLERSAIRGKIEREREKREAVMMKQTTELEKELNQLIQKKLVKAEDMDNVLDMLNYHEMGVLDQLCKGVMATVQNDWMSEESRKNFVQNIAKVILERLVNENLKDRVSEHIDQHITNPTLGVDYYLKMFRKEFSSVADKIGEHFISSVVQQQLVYINEQAKALQERISSFICDHVGLFDKPDMIQEMLEKTDEECQRKDLHQLIRGCMEMKKVRNEIQREQQRRQGVEERLTKELMKEVRPFIQGEFMKAREMADVNHMITTEKKEILDKVYGNIKGLVNVIEWMSTDERKAFADKITESVLKAHVHKDLEERVTQKVKTDVTDPKLSVDEHVKGFASKYAFATSIVGEAFITYEVRQQILVLKERQQEKEAEEARTKKEIQKKICRFITEHIDLYDNSKKIEEQLAEKGEEFCGERIKQMIEDCLQDPDVQNKIHIYKEEQRQIHIKAALQKVEKSAEEHVTNFICNTSNSQVYACAGDPSKAETHVGRLANRVDNELCSEINGYVTLSEIQAVVREILALTLANITDATFMEKVKMYFSQLLGIKTVLSVMLPYVGKAVANV